MRSDTALHRAVQDGDYETTRKLAGDPEFLMEKNSCGFTALELAQYLDRKECLRVLASRAPQRIKIVLPNEARPTVFTEEEFEKAFHLKYLDYLHFPSYQELKRAIRNCPWSLRHTPFGAVNRSWGRRYRAEMESAYIAPVILRWIDNTLGYGVYAETDIEERAYVGEYTGLVRRLSRWTPDPNEYCFHYPTRLWSLCYYAVDAQKEGNALRFVNHSDIPNLEPISIVDEKGLLHIGFVTTRRIKAGEQLTFNYGGDYWKRRAYQKL